MNLNEFDIIEKIFSRKTHAVLGPGDDAAIIEPAPNHQIVITTDTLVENIHFLANISPYDLGFKSLAVNLSDLAAMGATPMWITLALTLPHVVEDWLNHFSQGLFTLATKHGVELIGGDLTQGPLTITIQALGYVPKNQALLRSGAKPGDKIYVSNTLGDAALALKLLKNTLVVAEELQQSLLEKLNRPTPQLELGKKLIAVANSAIDISDGLAADLGHILKKSGVGAKIYVDKLPLSKALCSSVKKEAALDLALNGGDDYELCFTVPQEKISLLKNIDFITEIGIIQEHTGLDLRFQDETKYHGNISGYKHF